MNILILLQAAAGVQPQGSQWSFWIMIAVLFTVMWFFMIRPQRKQQKELEKFRSSLQKGDKVVTVGGIYGTIHSIKENDPTVLLKVDGDVKLKVDRRSLVKDYTEQQQ